MGEILAGLGILVLALIAIGFAFSHDLNRQMEIKTIENACNVACKDKKIMIDDNNKCYCLNGNDWIYNMDLNK